MINDVLGIGICGKALTDEERRILREDTPYGVVLFGRNINDAVQLQKLVRDIKSEAAQPPLIMIDEEGGRVDRLRNIIPGLPSAESFLEGEKSAEMAEWLGRVIGMALRFFDIEVDLAPVVDIRSGDAPKGLERRTFADTAQGVVDLAGAFIRGLHQQGVASCLKHWPGIGRGTADPHYGATVIDIPLSQLRQSDLVPFEVLGKQAGAIMIGHGTYPQVDDPDVPASLSRRLTADLLREIGFDGVAISDDMEMHAVSDLGSYEEIAEKALLAGNDVILFCSHIERVPDIQRTLRERVAEDATLRARFDDAVARAERYRQWCETLRRRAAAGPETFDDLVEETKRFCKAFEETRPEGHPYIPAVDRRKSSRTPGTGRSGREEWT